MTSSKFILGDGGMEKRSIRITHADRILGHLKVENRPLLTYEIFGWLHANRVVGMTTIYRALEKLRDADFTDSIAGLSARTDFATNHSVLETQCRCSDCGTGVPAH